MRSPTPNLIIRLLVLYDVSERLPGRRLGVVVQRVNGLTLGRDVTLVTQLVLPLVIRLGYHCATQ